MKKILSLLLALSLVFTLGACAAKPTEEPYTKTDVKVFAISGPTGVGMVNLMDKAEKNETKENYKFTVVASPNEVVSKISNKEADIAAVSTNIAAKLFNVTNGGIKVLAVNTLGVLNVITKDGKKIESLAELKGKTVYTTGQGANPEFIINYLLNKNGVNPATDLKINFKAEGSELLTVWNTEPEAIIIAPQPVATSIVLKYEGSAIAADLTKEWEKVDNASALMMGCVIVRTEFLEQHPKAVQNFMEEYAASVNAVTENLDNTATLCEAKGIIPKAAMAKKAIPYCNICFVTGNEMKTKLSGYLTVLENADKTSIGGKLPTDEFYYEK